MGQRGLFAPFYPGGRWTVPALPELLAAVHTDFNAADAQTIIRQNRDMLYSAAVFDLDAGPHERLELHGAALSSARGIRLSEYIDGPDARRQGGQLEPCRR